MKLVVGLGNPGKKYVGTRHNVGFMLLDAYVSSLSTPKDATWKFEKKFNAAIFKMGETILAKPQTFMNLSGEAVKKIIDYFSIQPLDVLIVHDDVDLAVGALKYKSGMGAAGHKGVSDIIQKLGTKEFFRLRIGVGRPETNKFDVHAFVLGSMGDIDLSDATKCFADFVS